LGNNILLQERLSPCWNLRLWETPADYQGKKVSEYLEEAGVQWEEGGRTGDVYLWKGNTVSDPPVLGLIKSFYYLVERKLRGPGILLLGEPRHKAAPYYRTADPKSTLACAPGKEFKRLYLPQVWKEPHVETWEKRLDKFVWFGAPYPDRVALAQKVLSWGVELDVYSREPWPIPGYQGPADDEYETSLQYKYRLAVENCQEHGYFSEKLFQSQRSGCLTFYLGDPTVDLSIAAGTYLPLTKDNVTNREHLAKAVLTEMDAYLHSTRWEWCSYKEMVLSIVEMAKSFAR